MKTLSKREKVAVFVSIGFVAYLLYGGTLMALFIKPEPVNNQAQALPESGVRVQDISLGTGATASSGDVVTVHYVGTLPNGQVFDSSVDRNAPFTFTLGTGSVIRGWEEGLVGMKVGGKRRLIIAPDYGYGSERVGAIPPNSTLVFDVELLDVKKPM